MAVSTLLNAVTGITTGTSVATEAPVKAFQVNISGVATVRILVSLDNAIFVPLSADFTATGGVTDFFPWTFIRADVVAYTSGTVTVLVSG